MGGPRQVPPGSGSPATSPGRSAHSLQSSGPATSCVSRNASSSHPAFSGWRPSKQEPGGPTIPSHLPASNSQPSGLGSPRPRFRVEPLRCRGNGRHRRRCNSAAAAPKMHRRRPRALAAPDPGNEGNRWLQFVHCGFTSHQAIGPPTTATATASVAHPQRCRDAHEPTDQRIRDETVPGLGIDRRRVRLALSGCGSGWATGDPQPPLGAYVQVAASTYVACPTVEEGFESLSVWGVEPVGDRGADAH